MKTFKDYFQEDLDTTFFDESEFASKHIIDGEEKVVVLVEAVNQDAKMSYGMMKQTLNPKETAINKIIYTMYVREKDMRKRVTTNSLIQLDGKNYFVKSVTNTNGVYKLQLSIHAV